MSCAGTFTVAITESGKVLTWGKTTRGQLGRSTSEAISADPKAIKFPGFTNTKIVSLSATHGSSLLAVSGMYVFGYKWIVFYSVYGPPYGLWSILVHHHKIGGLAQCRSYV